MSGSNIKYHFGNEEWIETGRSVALGEAHHFFLKSDYSTDAACKNNSDSVKIRNIGGKSGVGYCLVTGHQCSLCKTIYLSRFLALQEICGFKILYFTGKAGFKF